MPPPVSPPYAMLYLMMCQEHALCHLHSELWALHPTPLDPPKRWAFPPNPSCIGCLQHPSRRVSWLVYHANHLRRVCPQTDLAEKASEDVKRSM